ncbi:AraC family transcriptional regulator [Leptospira gomenensis]|uniref:AraC family transcriptional regulator n=1 Tax=Leptospira gomenensis TaxID=2484974 RepID=A0A5F1YAL9_9LEPT|nr:AraC family transcriptional regulator [Leptospira gomenensis]TGK34446.1 AraC family transcriptional regulator [Leptospira gomenensis]TGK34995.1 AraC family transcriptional regulator [Leptospira gomenensis]TGK41832.1 AraC family transcriptional regulator [Leptospira gomenensis]TGK65156.1 AraC family transcriptional regulator [Leptospira gomenensis]
MRDLSRTLLYLWDNKGLFAGRHPDIELHTHAVHALCVGIDGEFEHSEDGFNWIRCRSAMAPPGTPSAIRFSGTYSVILFYEPNSSELPNLTSEKESPSRSGVILHLKKEKELLNSIETLIDSNRKEDIPKLLENICIPPIRRSKPKPWNHRLLPVMRLILQDPDENFSIEEMSQKVGLSPSRLAHLFKDEIGIPIRLFRTWFRLKTAILFIKNGASITEAAVNAGFYDSSHSSEFIPKNVRSFSDGDVPFQPKDRVVRRKRTRISGIRR